MSNLPSHAPPGSTQGIVAHADRQSACILTSTLQGGDPQAQRQEDVAALLSFRDERVRRGVRFHRVLRGGARVLANSAGSADTFDLSQPTSQMHTFISHNWAVPRHLKFIVLVLYFNLSSAVAVAVAALAVSVALIPYRLAPIYDCGGEFRQGILAVGVAMPLFYLVLFFGHELRPRGPLVFLDKVCIHQTDADLKEHGIRTLAAFVYSSKNLLICYTDLYLQRLWTVYEIATFLVVCSREGEHSRKAHLVPVSFAIFVLLSSFLCFALIATEHVLAFTAHNQTVLLSIRTALLTALVAVVARRWARQLAQTRDLLARFSFQRADCSVEADRALVAGNIVALMKHYRLVEEAATPEEVLEYFDGYVRRAVPRMLETSVGRAGIPYKYTVPLALVACADNLDRIIAFERTTRSALLDYFSTCIRSFCLYPNVVAVILWCTRRCMHLTGWQELLFGGAVALVAFLFIALFDPLHGLALNRLHYEALKGNDTMMGVLLAYQVVAAIVTLTIYRPLPQDLLKLEPKTAAKKAVADAASDEFN